MPGEESLQAIVLDCDRSPVYEDLRDDDVQVCISGCRSLQNLEDFYSVLRLWSVVKIGLTRGQLPPGSRVRLHGSRSCVLWCWYFPWLQPWDSKTSHLRRWFMNSLSTCYHGSITKHHESCVCHQTDPKPAGKERTNGSIPRIWICSQSCFFAGTNATGRRRGSCDSRSISRGGRC